MQLLSTLLTEVSLRYIFSRSVHVPTTVVSKFEGFVSMAHCTVELDPKRPLLPFTNPPNRLFIPVEAFLGLLLASIQIKLMLLLVISQVKIVI